MSPLSPCPWPRSLSARVRASSPPAPLSLSLAPRGRFPQPRHRCPRANLAPRRPPGPLVKATYSEIPCSALGPRSPTIPKLDSSGQTQRLLSLASPRPGPLCSFSSPLPLKQPPEAPEPQPYRFRPDSVQRHPLWPSDRPGSPDDPGTHPQPRVPRPCQARRQQPLQPRYPTPSSSPLSTA